MYASMVPCAHALGVMPVHGTNAEVFISTRITLESR